MKRLAVILFSGLILACGGQDSDLPAVDATKAAAEQAGDAMKEAAAEAKTMGRETVNEAAQKVADATESEAADGQAASCLELVSNGQFQQAVPVCVDALAANPANAQVRDALEKARAGVANLAAAPGAAAAQAQGAAADAAAGAGADAGEAAGELLGH